MIKLIAFDLDNVLLDGEAIDEIAKLAGVEQKISDLTRKAMEGDVEFETSLQQRINLLKGTSLKDIKQVVKQIPLMEGTEDTIKELKKRGYKLATITGNFQVVTDRLKDLDIDFIYCNHLHDEDGIVNGEISGPLMAEGSKADVLQELLDQEGITAEDCAAVGDGANDIPMIKKAGLGVAFNAKSKVKEVADIVIEKKDLREILPIFEIDNDDKTEGSNKEPDKSENMSTAKSEIEPDKNDDLADKNDDLEMAKEDNVKPDNNKADSDSNKEEDKDISSQVNADAGKSFSKLLGEKKDLEKNLKELTRARDKLNDEAKEQKQVRDDLNSSRKEILDNALEYRKQRDEINQEVKKYKKLRDETNQELKKLEWSSGKRDIMKIQDEIKKLDKTIETKVLDIRKENELVKRVTDLQKKLQTMEEDENTQKEALELKEKSEEYHAKVVELSDQAQETHEKMLSYFQEIDEIRVKADEAHAEFMNTRDKASQKHEEVKNILKKIRGKNKSLDKAKARERHKEDIISEKKNSEEKEKAEEIYRKFRDGKKLTTDELLLLQKHNVV